MFERNKKKPQPEADRLARGDTLIEDMVAKASAEPLLYALKHHGAIKPGLGLALDADDLKQQFLFHHRRAITCTDPKCGCLKSAWAHHANGFEVVQVRLVEVAT